MQALYEGTGQKGPYPNLISDPPPKPRAGQQAPVLGPPPGTYDPQLDASLRAADRGLDYFKFDTARQGTRALEDYGIARDDATINRDRGRNDLVTGINRAIEDYGIGRGDIGREYDRAVHDIGTQRGDTKGDFSRALAELNRRYQFQQSAQEQQARSAGIMEGGYAAQAAKKRAANLAFDRAPLDTSLSRSLRDLKTSEGRVGENRDRAMLGLNTEGSRALTDFGTQGYRQEQDFGRLLGTPGSARSGLLYQGYSRGVEDRATGLQRAGAENREFGQDIMGSKYYQARYGAGTLPVWRPRSGGPRKRDPYAIPRRRR